MFELTLSIKLDKQKFLLDFQKKLTNEVGKNFAGMVSHIDDGRCSLAIACDDAKKEYIKAKVLSGIVDIIVCAYKYEYFEEVLSPNACGIMFMPFLKAISIFDVDSDYEIIKSEIDLAGEIVIDSFYNFKLQALKLKWEKTAQIILKNAIVQSDVAMIEVIKYLSNSSENYSLVLNVEIFDKKIEIKNYLEKKSFFQNDDGIARFLTEVVSLNPLKINLFANFAIGSDNKVYNILCELFGEKIYMQN